MTMDEAWKVAVPNAREDLMKRRRRKLKNRVSGLEALVISIFNPILSITHWRLRDRLRSRLKSGRSFCLRHIPATTHMISSDVGRSD
jgi:hypothetical protein